MLNKHQVILLINFIFFRIVGSCSSSRLAGPEIVLDKTSLYASEDSLRKYQVYQKSNKCGFANDKMNRSNYILHGIIAKSGEFPWMAFFAQIHEEYGISKEVHCSGQILTKKFVLTAGHCVSNKAVSTYVMVGHFVWKNLEDLDDFPHHTVEKIFLHRGFDSIRIMFAEISLNDIALVKLKHGLDFSYSDVGIACLPILGFNATNLGFKEGVSNTTILGYGHTEYGTHSCCLRYAEGIRTLSTAECKISMKKESNQHLDTLINIAINGKTLCVQGDNKNRVAACQGDSGGGIYFKTNESRYVLFGATSFGRTYNGFCDYQYPAVTTSISAHISWIVNVIENNENLEVD